VPPLVEVETSHPISEYHHHKLTTALQNKVRLLLCFADGQLEDLADTPVVFELVQIVQEEIGYFSEELGRGYFGFLPTDILRRIFEVLDLPTLCNIYPVTKLTNRPAYASLACPLPSSTTRISI
jgi:hypothetical protein